MSKFVPNVPYPNALSFDGASEVLDMPVTTIRCYYKTYGIPHVQCGGRTCFFEEELVAWKRRNLDDMKAKIAAEEQRLSQYRSAA